LLDGFRLESDGSAIFLSKRSQRLLGFLALKGRPITPRSRSCIKVLALPEDRERTDR
jgi:hypothetical protein